MASTPDIPGVSPSPPEGARSNGLVDLFGYADDATLEKVDVTPNAALHGYEVRLQAASFEVEQTYRFALPGLQRL